MRKLLTLALLVFMVLVLLLSFSPVNAQQNIDEESLQDKNINEDVSKETITTSELYNGTIQRGDGYQINNYVIDVVDVFVEANSASFNVYEKDEKIKEPLISPNGSFSFDFEDDSKVEVRLNSVSSGTLPVAKISIVLSDYNIKDLHTNQIIDGGHDEASFAGTPELDITKGVNSNTIKVDKTVKITVKAQNTGDDKATDVIFSDPMQEHFVLEETFVDQTGPMSIDKGETKTIAVYLLKATESGTFKLKPTTATFSNTAGQNFPQSSSNTPTVTVEPAEKDKAVLNITTEADSFTIPRGETVTSTINLKNTGKASAESIQLSIDVPDGMEYVNGDDEIEVIDGVPKVYMESFGEEQEKEISFSVKANEIGTYNLATQLSYNNGADEEEITRESTTKNIHVKEGKFDFLFSQPVYVYVLPILIIIGISGWIFYKHREYKF